MLHEEAHGILAVHEGHEVLPVHAGGDVANDHRLTDVPEVEGDPMALRHFVAITLGGEDTVRGFEDAPKRRAVHGRDGSRLWRPRQAFLCVMVLIVLGVTGCGPMPHVMRAIDEGDFADARTRLQTALEREPNDRDLLWWLARVEMLDERPEDARVVLSRIIAIDPADVGAHIEIGISYELGRDYSEALAAYVRATERAPRSAKAFRWLGQRLLRWGQPVEAVSPLTRATELDATDIETWGALGRAQLLAEDPAAAEATLRRAITIHPNDRDLVLALGLVMLSGERWAEALVVYDEVVERWPRFAPAHVGRGILLDTLGRRPEALSAFEAAARVDPRERLRVEAYHRRLRAPAPTEPPTPETSAEPATAPTAPPTETPVETP